METVLLLNESTEPPDVVIPILPKIYKHPDEPFAGCTCDRWGHPCPGCPERKEQPPPISADSLPNQAS
jgi:hypothetical protein